MSPLTSFFLLIYGLTMGAQTAHNRLSPDFMCVCPNLSLLGSQLCEKCIGTKDGLGHLTLNRTVFFFDKSIKYRKITRCLRPHDEQFYPPGDLSTPRVPVSLLAKLEILVLRAKNGQKHRIRREAQSSTKAPASSSSGSILRKHNHEKERFSTVFTFLIKKKNQRDFREPKTQ